MLDLSEIWTDGPELLVIMLVQCFVFLGLR